MSQEENQKPNIPKKSPKNNRKVWINVITLFLSFAVLLAIVSFSRGGENNKEAKTFSDLISEVRKGSVSKIEVSADRRTLNADIYKNLEKKDRNEVEKVEYPNVAGGIGTSVLENINNALGNGDQSLKIGSAEGEIIYVEKENPWYVTLFASDSFWTLIFIIVTIGIAIMFIRRIADTNSRAISFGNSRAKTYDELEGKDKITFADVAGNEEAKQELWEVVDFLKRSQEYTKIGAKIPRGVLLVGSPGNGKTLMAKAVAGEADVPFFFVSGSEFVEMFVGVGAGRVRDLFKRAKKKSPCIVFIDEIDAVGRQRGAGLGGGNDEREQTLNQILVEMDGFEANTSVIVIGATNRPDVLDPALLRPGRFDRQVTVTSPDRKERLAILKIHSKNKKMAEDVDLDIIAKRTPGFSGADLMNVLNEAAILAVRDGKKMINNDVLREAIEKVVLGPSLKTKVVTDEQKKLTAYHEAGHALTATVLPMAEKVQKVTIIPRGRAGGYTFSADNENDSMTKKRSEFLASITVLFGGYCTEELVYGEVSTGASNDLSKATELARKMVTKYGMSELGPVSYDEDHGLTFLGKDMAQKQAFSEEIAGKIDEQTNKILQSCYARCKAILTKYREYLDKIAETLIETEVLEYEEFNKIVDGAMNKWEEKMV
jgi:cell division protease FtsH